MLDHFTARQLMSLTAERMQCEDCERQAALQRAIMDAGVFKVQTTLSLNWDIYKYIKIFDTNFVKVQQKLAGYLAHQVKSVADAKKLFQIETDGLANFACAAGLINRGTSAYEMDALKHELTRCLRPLQMTDQLREFATAPTPPPVAPSPPPPGLFSPRSPPPSPPRFNYQWRVGGITLARAFRAGQ